MKKTILLLIAAMICVANSYGQRRLKYKDIYDKLGHEPAEHTLLKLNEFQSMTPEFPNTYVQTALIQWAWLQDEDPFLNYPYVRQLIYNTKLYLGLAISKIQADEREVKKNSTYYANLGVGNSKEVSQEAVLQVLNDNMDKVKEYDEHVTKIIENFNIAVDKYNACTETFKSIVGRQSNYKNLLVTNSAELRAELKKLARDFDSVMLCFGIFKNELANYPIKNYNQQLDIKPIDFYRLEGLTSSNFIQPKIPIWDYQGWVKEATKLLDGNIKDIKDNSTSDIKAMRARVAALQAQNAETDSIQTIVAANKLLNLTEKYDYESLLSATMRYEAAKANLQVASLRSTNNIQNPESFNSDYNQKAAYYYDLYLMGSNCRSTLREQTSRINAKTLALHEQSISNLYGSKEKFASSYRTDEEKALAAIEASNLEHFKAFTVEQFAPENVTYAHDGKQINAAPSSASVAEAPAGEYTTTYTCKSNVGVRYVAGYRKISGEASVGFIAKVDVEGHLLWAKDVAGSSAVVQILPVKTGGFLVLTVSTAGGVVKGSVIKMDNEGRQQGKVDLSSTLYPVTFTYDEISETVAVVCKGKHGNYDTESNDDVVLETVNMAQKQSSFSPYFKLKGKVADVVKGSTGYVIVCNYTDLSVGGKSYTSKSDVASVTTVGDKLEANVCGSKDEVRAIKAFKINAETINITGAYDNLASAISSAEKPAYILLSADGKFYYKN
ncbi:MAG: hypothetical protein IKP73_02555 [Bacteroidales bacterium]|nr:hypothetical protein [Bacteroidales bacterium]